MDLDQGLKLVIFDFDGTLLDLDVDWERVRQLIVPAGSGDTIGAALQRLVTAGDPLVEQVTAIELEGLGDATLAPAVADTLRTLAGEVHLAVCTRNTREAVVRSMRHLPVRDRIHVVGREDTPLLKPDPSGLHRILEHFGVAAAAAVLVGDTYHDVQAARAAGIGSIVVRNPRLAYAPEGADHYVERIDDLPALLR